jgi:TPR repeat protein
MRIPLTVLLLLRLSVSAQGVPVCVSSLLDVSVLIAKAESGDPNAQLELGKYYDATDDQAKFPQAAYWFSKSADQGNPDAEWRLRGCLSGW